MKKLAYSLIALVGLLWSCQKEKIDIGMPLGVDQLDWTYQETETKNVFTFINNTPGTVTYWDFGNGASAEGKSADTQYPFAGEYTVKMTVLAQGGSTVDSMVMVIESGNPLLIDSPVYNFLTGGASNVGGKSWKIDKMNKAHMGIGPADNPDPIWWSANPLDKDGRGAYDDLINFDLNELSFTLTNNGDTYAKSYMHDYFAGMGAELLLDDDDNTYAIEFNDQSNWKWSLSETEDGDFLTLSGGAFPAWHVGGNQVYEIVNINEDELYLRTIGGDANAWYIGFIREGFDRPVEEEKPKEYKSEDIMDAFDGAGNIAWEVDAVNFWGAYDNPRIHDANTSMRVGKYERDAGQQFGNVFSVLEYRMDLTERNVITLKAYFPSYNDYTTEDANAAPWMPYKNLQMQVAVKLQNSLLGGDGWTTQHEIAQIVDVTDEWVELTFDFSDSADREDFDKVVLQIGGEGQHLPGTFFVDDFKLE